MFDKPRLIFDFDETLVWLQAPWRDYVSSLADEYADRIANMRLKKEQLNVITIRNYLLDKVDAKLVADLNTSNGDFEKTSIYNIEYNWDLINWIKANCNQKEMFIWSGNSRAIITKILEELKISDCFSKIISADDVIFLKPYPDGFNAINNPPHSLEEYLLIGDSQFDQQAAKNIGIDFYKIDYFKTDSNFKPK